MSADNIDSRLTNIINNHVKNYAFSDSTKVASIHKIFNGKGARKNWNQKLQVS